MYFDEENVFNTHIKEINLIDEGLWNQPISPLHIHDHINLLINLHRFSYANVAHSCYLCGIKCSIPLKQQQEKYYI